ncbi:hypothetical protein SAY87_029276 [Trapa incisa]|uniref:NAC domain-containing protein n=1 Tax=Trapa incisa TaxID=236973 RepID=A0AAN7QQ02_9MYRT|nr:hypothetical protein SAY87_029276 [Trapa incisa]
MGSSSSGGVPPGFRFHPTDEELLQYYLQKKVSFQKFDMEVIREVDLNKMEPWELQERCRIGSTPQNEWYFFSHKDKKYPTGSRTNRATNAGFWKATGRDKCIRDTCKKIGMRKTLVFYRGRAPHGQKTDWIMHEYRLEDGDDPQGNLTEDGWVVCRVFKKKNLFKTGNEVGGSSINSDYEQHYHYHQQQQQGNINSSNIHNSQAHTNFTHRGNPHNGLRQQQQFELNKPAHLSLHYSSHLQPSQYSLFPSTEVLITTQQKPHEGYSFGPTRDDEGGSDNFRYGGSHRLEVATSEQSQVQARSVIGVTDCREEPGISSEWAMLVGPHHIGSDPHQQQDSSKAKRFEIEGTDPHHHINQLSIRGEMDFWGYSAK